MTFRCRALLLRKKSMYASVDLLVPPDGQNAATPSVLQPLLSDLSASFNGMNLNMWSCTSSSLFLAQCSLDFRSTKRALYEVLSTKSSTKRQKKQGTLKALLNPNFTSTKLSALVYNFRKEFERYKAGPVRREPCLVESSAEWSRSLPLS